MIDWIKKHIAPSIKKHLIPLLIAASFGVASAGYSYFDAVVDLEHTPIAALERKVLDFKFLSRGRRDPIHPKVVIAAGDEKTIAAFGRWGTWDRSRYAKILDNLFAAGADVVAFDMVFADPIGLDHESTASLGKLLADAKLSDNAGSLAVAAADGKKPSAADIAKVALSAKAVEDAFASSTSGDAVFAAALDRHGSRVVQGFIAEPEPEAGQAPREDYAREIEALDAFVIKTYGWGITKKTLSAKGTGAEDVVIELDEQAGGKAGDLSGVMAARGELVLPSKVFLDVAYNTGFFSAHTDPDGTLRRLPLVFRAGDVFLPSLSMSAAAQYFGGSPLLVAEPFFKRGLARIGFPGEGGAFVDVETDVNGRLLINYYGPSGPNDPSLPDDKRGAFPRVSLADVHAGSFDAAVVKGKVVLIAVTAIGTFDQRVTPFSPNVPGIEVHAAALQNMIDGVELKRPTGFVQLQMLISLLIAVALGLVLPRVNVGAGLAVFVGSLLAWWLIDVFIVFPSNRWFYDVPMTLQLVGTWAGITVWGYLTEGREKAHLKKEFSTVLAPTVVDQLLKDPKLAGLGGMERELTVMFSDIRGFTTMSEKLTPEGLTQFLNEYLTPMTEILIQREGTLDKYMGDAIMAFWGAPIEQRDHACRAALAALDMLEKLDQLKVKWRGEGKPEIEIGIGLNSGLMRVGFMGSARMRNYTLLGDNVNLGSRLEGTNKNYGTRIIVSEKTFEQSKSVVCGRWLDAVRVKGKLQPVNIYEILGKNPATPELKKLIDVFEAGLKHYRAQQWDDAELAFGAAIKLRPDGDPPSDVYLERVAHFRKDPPPEKWDGVYEFKTK